MVQMIPNPNLNLPSPPLQPFNVLAFDPGGTTGWAQAILQPWRLDLDSEIKIGDIIIQTGELGPQEHHLDLHNLIKMAVGSSFTIPPEIVYEPFHYRQNVVGEGETFRGKVDLISGEYIGVIKLVCQQLGLSYYDRFTPGEAKAWCTDRKLEALGWMQTPKHPRRHQNDALRQLVKYLVVKKGVRHPITTAWRIHTDGN